MAKTNISATVDSEVINETLQIISPTNENRTFSNYVETALRDANKKRKRKTSAQPVYSTSKKHK